MVDFTKILSRKTDTVRAPEALPIGDYPAIIRQQGMAEKRRGGASAPVFRLTAALTAWPDSDEVEPQPGVDITKRTMQIDYYADDTGGTDQTWRLIKLAESLNIDCTGREIGEILPEFLGQQVLVEVQHYTNKQSGEVGNQVGKVVGLGG